MFRRDEHPLMFPYRIYLEDGDRIPEMSQYGSGGTSEKVLAMDKWVIGFDPHKITSTTKDTAKATGQYIGFRNVDDAMHLILKYGGN